MELQPDFFVFVFCENTIINKFVMPNVVLAVVVAPQNVFKDPLCESVPI